MTNQSSTPTQDLSPNMLRALSILRVCDGDSMPTPLESRAGDALVRRGLAREGAIGTYKLTDAGREMAANR
jgi:hypothetical protein